ncbi:MAG: hypothetical protein JXJ20_10380 [Anaerolineae bacterium]|nr:hypothetical protein [Anaerolineae bacterium]
MTNLWSSNTPAAFWQCDPPLPDHVWQTAIQQAAPLLGLPLQPDTIDDLLELVLGEGQFGSNRWRLTRLKCLYYTLKPLLTRRVVVMLRRAYSRRAQAHFRLNWPVEDRYACFLWTVMHQALCAAGRSEVAYRRFWPDGKQFAFVITHDIETAHGQAYVRTIADLDERYGFRATFSFVPELYPLDYDLLDELRERGFEVCVHGLKHDGKLFRTYAEFSRRAVHINHYLETFGAVGFRSPCTMRQPEWMQTLNIEYDLSFFDTDPHEPMPGGVMSIWPFVIGQFVELPYTLAQDHTLICVLGEDSARLWKDKLDFIERYGGLALVNAHPDYLIKDTPRQVYTELLQAVKDKGNYWHALPRDVARWWCCRTNDKPSDDPSGMQMGQIVLTDNGIVLR